MGLTDQELDSVVGDVTGLLSCQKGGTKWLELRKLLRANLSLGEPTPLQTKLQRPLTPAVGSGLINLVSRWESTTVHIPGELREVFAHGLRLGASGWSLEQDGQPFSQRREVASKGPAVAPASLGVSEPQEGASRLVQAGSGTGVGLQGASETGQPAGQAESRAMKPSEKCARALWEKGMRGRPPDGSYPPELPPIDPLAAFIAEQTNCDADYIKLDEQLGRTGRGGRVTRIELTKHDGKRLEVSLTDLAEAALSETGNGTSVYVRPWRSGWCVCETIAEIRALEAAAKVPERIKAPPAVAGPKLPKSCDFVFPWWVKKHGEDGAVEIWDARNFLVLRPYRSGSIGPRTTQAVEYMVACANLVAKVPPDGTNIEKGCVIFPFSYPWQYVVVSDGLAAKASPAEELSIEFDFQIANLELNMRTRKVLAGMGVETLGDLLQFTEAELFERKNLGYTLLNEIKALLADKGLALRKEEGKL